MKKTVVCCGNIAFDLITGDGASGSRGNITFRARPGGSVLNTAVLVSRLGLNVSMLAKTGKDFLGDTLRNFMQGEGLNTKYVLQHNVLKASLAFARIDEKGDSSYLFYRPEGSDRAFTKQEVPLGLIQKADVFHTASAFTYADFTFDNTLTMMKQAKTHGSFVTYDPNWRASRIRNKTIARARIHKLLPYVDLLKLSLSDAVGITGAKTLSGALRKLKGNVVVTLGDAGSFFWNGKKKTLCPAFKTRVVDTIGAGDGFTAGLIYRYCLLGQDAFRKNVRETLVFASAVSTLVCRGRGATEGLKGIRQTQRFIRSS